LNNWFANELLVIVCKGNNAIWLKVLVLLIGVRLNLTVLCHRLLMFLWRRLRMTRLKLKELRLLLGDIFIQKDQEVGETQFGEKNNILEIWWLLIRIYAWIWIIYDTSRVKIKLTNQKIQIKKVTYNCVSFIHKFTILLIFTHILVYLKLIFQKSENFLRMSVVHAQAHSVLGY